MANSWECPSCLGDGTRCECHKHRAGVYHSPEERVAQRIAELEREQEENLKQLQKLRGTW